MYSDMSREETLEILADESPDTRLADGSEGAMIGVARHFTRTLAMYDYGKCVEVLMQREGCSHEEACEYMEFNVVGAWVGDNTPLFVTLFSE